MKARKRINKLKTKIQNRSARGLDSVSLVNQLFQLVLPTMVQTLPEAVLYMEKSNSSVEIDTVRKQGRLLPKKDDWSFDPETVFPGSTAYLNFIQEKFDGHSLAQCKDSELTKSQRDWADEMWKPIAELSMLPASDITEHDRCLLGNFPYDQVVEHIGRILSRNGESNLQAPDAPAPELQHDFNQCMAQSCPD
jgi:hypothetical protein